MSTHKSSVVRLATPKELQERQERRADAYMTSEEGIRDLAIGAKLARHLYFKELEDGHPISPAGSPLFAISYSGKH